MSPRWERQTHPVGRDGQRLSGWVWRTETAVLAVVTGPWPGAERYCIGWRCVDGRQHADDARTLWGAMTRVKRVAGRVMVPTLPAPSLETGAP